MPALVLASGSPRRHDLLSGIGLQFTVAVPDVDESLVPGESPTDYVARVAALKAATASGAVVLSADTTVVLNGEIIGKPTGASHARSTLAELSGNTHQVYTAVCVAGPLGLLIETVRSDVTLAAMSDAQIEWYVATGEPMDKAGAYGLQGIGMAFVDGVVGSVTNVIGLPMTETVALLADQGIVAMHA